MSEGDPSEALWARVRLPERFAYLERQFPRSDWGEARLHAVAAHWLEMHGWFRELQRRLAAIVTTMPMEAATLQRAAMPLLQQFVPTLAHHHEIESGHYFPAMRTQEPRIAAGLDLLDEDHEAVHAVLETLADRANALNRALASGGTREGADDAAKLLADAIRATATPLQRHLHDEEDIVIPLLTLRGDPFDLAARAGG